MKNNNFNDDALAMLFGKSILKMADEHPEMFKETSSDDLKASTNLEEENLKLKESIRQKNKLILSLIDQSEKLWKMSNDLINEVFSDEEPDDEIKEALESIGMVRSVNKLIKMTVELEEKGQI